MDWNIFIAFWGLFGLFWIMCGIIIFKNMEKKKRVCTSKTSGKVIDIEEDTREMIAYSPVFEYTVGDHKYVKEYTYGSNVIPYKIGQEVEIYYNPNKPDQYYVKGDTLYKRVTKIAVLIGICFLFVSLIFVVIALMVQNG